MKTYTKISEINFNKKIIKSYEVLYKYIENNKFNIKKNDNFIHLYLLFIQNNYKLDFNFKNFTKSKELHKCLKSLYSKNSSKKNRNFLFSGQELLANIFFKSDDFDVDKYLLKLEEKVYSLEYVGMNIEFIDYFGKASNDIEIINTAFCLYIFTKQFPDIKVNRKLFRTIVKSLIKVIEPKNNQIKYTNTNALVILFLLGKVREYENLDNYIIQFCNNQQENGKWINGFNSYFVKNTDTFDILHTCFGLIVLMEYKMLDVYKRIINNRNDYSSSDEENIINDIITNSTLNVSDEKINNEEKTNKEEELDNKLNNNKKVSDDELSEEEINVRIENINSNEKEEKEEYEENELEYKDTIETFENINTFKDTKFELNLNFYNITLILVLILILINWSKINKYLKIPIVKIKSK